MTEPLYDAVLIVSFGGPEAPEEVVPFLRRVTRGRGIPEDRLDLVAEHYYHFGGVSPINAEVRRFIERLRPALQREGVDLPVYWGNRNWSPFLEDTVVQMAADGIRTAVAYATSVFSSYPGCRQYLEDIEWASAACGDGAPAIDKVAPIWDSPGFLAAVGSATSAALGRLGAAGEGAELIFTAHSLPCAMAETSEYVAQLEQAAAYVASPLGPARPWSLAFQSRSGPPTQPWLGPDITDHLEAKAERGLRAAVLVPIGFVSDHIEVLYDLDIEAAAKAKAVGIKMERAATVGADPLYVDQVAKVLADKVAGRAGEAGITGHRRPEPCELGCCPKVAIGESAQVPIEAHRAHGVGNKA